ncbi:hypothetical protein [Verrucomicrobium sp. BvORR034]|uniref:hypothetical protein n=1 Tax=Verrucomicrobium sp. BvORR034 TaxID=1396418 RepID=UPI0006788AE8|nr:hypothetical protein [Verrucomicrobium sp. BvORR034]
MNLPPAESGSENRRPKSFWSRVEAAGDTMELGMRAFLGFFFAIVLSSGAGYLGGEVWVGVGVILAILTFPFAFLIGFFWLEVKFALQLLIRFVIRSIVDG